MKKPGAAGPDFAVGSCDMMWQLVQKFGNCCEIANCYQL
jgi:hypothetical protein